MKLNELIAIRDNAPDGEIEVMGANGHTLVVTHFSQSLNVYMVRDNKSGLWFSYDDSVGYLYHELPQSDMCSLADINVIIELTTTRDELSEQLSRKEKIVSELQNRIYDHNCRLIGAPIPPEVSK